MSSVILGSGPLGLAVAGVLISKGETPIIMSRSATESPAGSRQMRGSVLDPHITQLLPHNAVIYHCANAPYHKWPQELPGLWQAVIDVAAAIQGQIVASTNLYAFGRPMGLMGSDHGRLPHTRKGKVRNRVEMQLKNAHQERDIPSTLVRGSDFYGPNVLQSALGDRFFLPALRGKRPSWPSDTGKLHSLTYIRDFARVMVAAAEKNTWGREWITPEEKPMTGREATERVAKILGMSLSPRTTGRLTFAIGGLFVPAAHEMLEMLYEFEEEFVVDAQRTIAELNIRPTPIDKALEATIEWYRAHSAKRAA